jgi:5-methylcytosine-specific restriction endonuclease McrA
MPTPKSKRNYKKEYKRDHSSTTAKKNRAKRNAANRKLKPGPGKEVDHKKPLSKGGGNGKKNLRVVSRSANRKKATKTVAKEKKDHQKKEVATLQPLYAEIKLAWLQPTQVYLYCS